MNHQPKLVGVLCVVAVALFQPGCAAPIPREDVPVGWALDVHQPGEWWTRPLIPRSVVVQRCRPPPGWASDPDLTKVTGLPPGSDVEYSSGVDDYHCLIGWSEPASEVEFSPDEMAAEAGLRRVCSSSGLRMDASWRFLGHNATERVGNLLSAGEVGLETWEVTAAAFIDDYDTVVGCLVEHLGEAGAGAFVELSVGADTAAAAGGAACPVMPRNMSRDDDGTLSEYQLRGAGAVRDDGGRILTEATTLQIGVAGDSVTTSHPVVDGIAIVDAWVNQGSPSTSTGASRRRSRDRSTAWTAASWPPVAADCPAVRRPATARFAVAVQNRPLISVRRFASRVGVPDRSSVPA